MKSVFEWKSCWMKSFMLGVDKTLYDGHCGRLQAEAEEWLST